ncbi:hypothetical protein [Luteitalea sp.]
MTRRIRVATLALACSLCAGLATAQDTAATFDRLRPLVTPGDTIIVTDTQGHETRGRLTRLSPSSLAIDVDGTTREWSVHGVREVRRRQGDSLINGTLIGLGVGAGVGVGLGIGVAATELYAGDTSGDDGAVAIVLGAALGAGIGLGIDAGRRDEVVLFSAPGRPQARVRLGPLVTTRAQGIRVAFVF